MGNVSTSWGDRSPTFYSSRRGPPAILALLACTVVSKMCQKCASRMLGAQLTRILKNIEHRFRALNSEQIFNESQPFSALTLLVGRHGGHPACKVLCVGLLMVKIGLELCTFCWSQVVSTISIILSSNKVQNGHILVTGLPGLSWKVAVKRVSCQVNK